MILQNAETLGGSMFEIVVFAAGVVVFLSLFFGLDFFHSKVIDDPVRRRQSTSPSAAENLPYATCSKDLELRLRDVPLAGASVTFVGGDGSYFKLSNATALTQLIEKIARDARQVDYLLLEPTEDVFDFISSSGLGRLKNVVFWRFDPSKASIEQIDLSEKYLKEHPTLFKLKEGHAFWHEGHHPSLSTVAYGVKFVRPEAMNAAYMEQFNEFDKDIAMLLESSEAVELKESLSVGKAA